MTRVAELEKGIQAAGRLATRLPHQEACATRLGHLCDCEHEALIRLLVDLRRDSVPRPAPGDRHDGIDRPRPIGPRPAEPPPRIAPDVDADITSLEALVERQRADAAELRATALERELVLAQEASRTLAHAYLTDGRPPSHLLAYASSLPVQLPHVDDLSAAVASLEALLAEERAEVARLKGRVAELEASLPPADATAGGGR